MKVDGDTFIFDLGRLTAFFLLFLGTPMLIYEIVMKTLDYVTYGEIEIFPDIVAFHGDRFFIVVGLYVLGLGICTFRAFRAK